MHILQRYLDPLSWKKVEIEAGFWGTRLETNQKVTLNHQYEQLEETGRLDNFRRAAGKKKGEFQGLFFNDSDVYKWLEAASYSLWTHPHKKLEQKVKALIKEIAAAQQEDGYLNTYFILEKKQRFTNLPNEHELYCAGHLFEAAVAYYQATGRTFLLKVAIRLADLICETFGPGKRPGAPGHQEIELALMKLYWLTKKERYLRTAAFFIDERGKGLAGKDQYHQDHLPFLQQKEMVGHAVRCAYLMSGACDVYRQTGNQALMLALKRLWENMVQKKMYVTGAIGSRCEGEALGKDYELPNDRAYAETCAAIGSILWNERMLQLTGQAKYADVMERVLFNAFLSGVSLDGKEYFYQNTLQSNGTHRRQTWFECACCPPNIARLLSSLGGYFYSTSQQGVWIHLYGESKMTARLSNDRKILLSQSTNYPWSGEVTVRVLTETEIPFTLFLRVPGWCQKAEVLVNDKPLKEVALPGSYLPISRTWKKGDEVHLSLSMPALFLETHPHSSNNGRLAISRGPLIYCLEAVDHPGVDILDILLSPQAKLSPHFRPDLLGGVEVLQDRASVRDRSGWKTILYRSYRKNRRMETKPLDLTAIPYFSWANRRPGKMLVWILGNCQELDP